MSRTRETPPKRGPIERVQDRVYHSGGKPASGWL